MQEGIGRGGYRLLAIVFLVVGLLGIASFALAHAYGSAVFAFALGCGLVAASLVVLFFIALRGLSGNASASPGVPSRSPSNRVLDVEYLDEGDAEATREPGEPVPTQPNRNLAADTKGWPARKGPTGVTRGEAKKAEAAKPVRFESIPGQVAVARASLRAPNEPPTVLARETSRNATPPEGMAKGQCGTCGTILLAPQVRPLKLRCPKCQKVTTLS